MSRFRYLDYDVFLEFFPIYEDKILTSGGYGSVYESENSTIVKVFNIEEEEEDNSEHCNLFSFFRELNIYSRITHPCIISILAWSYNPDQNQILLSMHKGESILDAIKEEKITLEQTIRDILEIVKFLHSKGIFHGDIKDENIIFYDGRACLIDFGLSYPTYLSDKKGYVVNGVAMTFWFRHPKYYKTLFNSVKTEYYSIGKVIASLIDDLYDIEYNNTKHFISFQFDGHPLEGIARKLLTLQPPNYSLDDIIDDPALCDTMYPGDGTYLEEEPLDDIVDKEKFFRDLISEFLIVKKIIEKNEEMNSIVLFQMLILYRRVYPKFEEKYRSELLRACLYFCFQFYYNDDLLEIKFKQDLEFYLINIAIYLRGVVSIPYCFDYMDNTYSSYVYNFIYLFDPEYDNNTYVIVDEENPKDLTGIPKAENLINKTLKLIKTGINKKVREEFRTCFKALIKVPRGEKSEKTMFSRKFYFSEEEVRRILIELEDDKHTLSWFVIGNCKKIKKLGNGVVNDLKRHLTREAKEKMFG